MRKEGRKWVLRRFQQLRSYHHKIETWNRDEIFLLFTNSSKGSFSYRRTIARGGLSKTHIEKMWQNQQIFLLSLGR